MRRSDHPVLWLSLAFVEGCSCLVIEIAGARSLAPYFGTSHLVWTAQITATLLFLALGYALGGSLSARRDEKTVGRLLAGSALWLIAGSFTRAPILVSSAALLGISFGSFVAASVLFGPALLSLGAVGPLLVGRLSRVRKQAGAAAGRVLFWSTLGGLVGGWLAALWSLEHLGVRLTLTTTAFCLVLIAALWTRAVSGALSPRTAIVPAGLLLVAWVTPAPLTEVGPANARGTIVWSGRGPSGLVQVLDLPAIDGRFLLVDGTVQGAERRSSGKSLVEFSDYLHAGSLYCRPDARSALVVGLGGGTLARSLSERGLRTVAVEIDSRVIEAARRFFNLPPTVEIVNGDAREYIRRETRQFDVIVLDVYRGESFPWHLATVEAIAEFRARLAPGGCLAVNAIMPREGPAPGLGKLEASLLESFDRAVVFHGGGDGALLNATLLASDALPGPERAAGATGFAHFASYRPAERRARAPTDDRSDFDDADAALRVAWRTGLLSELDPNALID